MGRDPAKTTINHHNIALRSIFDLAVVKKYMNRNQVPTLTVKDKGRKTIQRPSFNAREYMTLTRKMYDWQKNGRTFTSRYKRSLLRHYMAFLANTGMRPGEESMNLRWRDIKTTKKGIVIDSQYGKHEPRQPVARHQVIFPLKNLKKLTKRTARDDLLFCMPDGKKATGFSAMFTEALVFADLLYDNDGKRRSLYSLRHMYATYALLRDIDYHTVSKQMGTSIAMLERHYSHLIPLMRAEELSQ